MVKDLNEILIYDMLCWAAINKYVIFLKKHMLHKHLGAKSEHDDFPECSFRFIQLCETPF